MIRKIIYALVCMLWIIFYLSSPHIKAEENKTVMQNLHVLDPHKITEEPNHVIPKRMFEVKILVQDSLQMETIRAIGISCEFPGEMVCEIDLSQMENLTQHGIKMELLRNYMLYQGGRNPNPATGPRDDNVYAFRDVQDTIPDNCAMTLLDYISFPSINCAYKATYVDVHFEIIHPRVSDLWIYLWQPDSAINVILYWAQYDTTIHNIDTTWENLTNYWGCPVRGPWQIWGIDRVANRVGYLDKWWIKVYYDPDYDIWGYLCYWFKEYNQNGFTGVLTEEPIRRAKVKLYEAHSADSAILLNTTYTWDDGLFYFHINDTADPDSNCTCKDIFIVCYAEDENGIIKVVFPYPDYGKTHSWSSPTYTNWDPGIYGDLDLSMATDTNGYYQNGFFTIYESILSSADYLASLYLWPGSTVKCVWAPGYIPPRDSVTGYLYGYIHISGAEDDRDEFDRDTQRHEYFHYLQDNAYSDMNTCGPEWGEKHGWNYASDPQVAWTEGSADFFPCAVKGDSFYVDVDWRGPAYNQIWNLEEPTDAVQGAKTDGANAAILWDIFDSKNDRQDSLSAGISPIFDVIFDYMGYYMGAHDDSCTIYGFWNGWFELGYDNGLALTRIFREHIPGFTGTQEYTTSDILPQKLSLEQNYPNPFNPETIIRYNLPKEPEMVKLVIYNVLGQKVRTLVNEEEKAGTYRVLWDGTDDQGVKVASGIYLSKIEIGGFSEVKKMVLVK